MKKSKTQKGITMAALILTIIVLIILVAVAVSTVKEDDIVGHAQNEKDKAQQLETKYNDLIAQQSNYLNYNPNDSFHAEHTFDEGTIITEATCTTEGEIEYTCTFEDCTYSYTDSIAALGHALTPNGIYNEYNETYHTILNDCTRCGTTNIQNGLEAHSFTNYVINSENGTKTAKCDKCSATDTITITVALSKTSGEVFKNNTVMIDDYGNKVKVPAGFKIASDSATAVTGGVVIEDANYENTIGSQFVWVPVGNIKTSTSDTVGTTITLGRYTFDETNGTVTYQGDAAINTYFEELETSSYGNTTAINLENFLASASENGVGGYYIGRYEARTDSTIQRENTDDELPTMTTIKTNAIYNWVLQREAGELSQSMYETETFSSDLINSYAWDTALVFIQTFSGDTDYLYQTTFDKRDFAVTGTDSDVVCNIYDMAGNCQEWSTETFCRDSSNGTLWGTVLRGDTCKVGEGPYMPISRVGTVTNVLSSYYSFRPIIYLSN